MIRVFPRRTKWTPVDVHAFVGDPPLTIPNKIDPVMVSVTFTWDIPEGQRLVRSWSRFSDDVKIGGPAFGDPGGEFERGRFVHYGFVTTSRGCPKSCGFCFVPEREGPIREIEIKDGWNVFDNNLLACSRDHIESVFEMLRRQHHQAHFTGGLDKTLLKPWHIDLMKSVSFKRAWFALDDPAHFPALERAADLLSDFPKEKKYCYVLVGYRKETPQEAEERLMQVFRLGFMPFSMLYRGPETTTRMHQDLAWRKLIRKWCNPARYKAFMRDNHERHHLLL
jgi:hypothetical protein